MNVNPLTCDLDRIELFLERQLGDADLSAFESHLSGCDDRRRRLETAVASEDIWSEMRASLQNEQLPPDSPRSGDSESTGEDASSSQTTVLNLLGPTDDDRMLGRWGGYEVVGVVGSGGMGVVLKALDAALNRYVAIKILAPHLGSSGAAIKRFSREGKAAAAVVHDNVIEIYGVAEAAGLPYLVMPYVRGPSLQRRLDDEGPLAVVEILRVGMQAAAGLAAAHAQGLVHRDVKPANILLADGIERVKLTDFGLARAADDASLTRTGIIAGTPQYMSPEQARGEPVDQRSDLFSLGSVLYAMCTGRPPFRAETSYGVLRRITDEESRPIREINPEIPEWLCGIVARLMAKRFDYRFQSAREVAALLEQCLAHVQQPTAVPLPDVLISLRDMPGVRAADPRKRRPFAGGSGRKRVLVAATGLLFLGGLGLALGILIHLKKDDKTTTVDVPDGSTAHIEADGSVTVELPSSRTATATASQSHAKAVQFDGGHFVKVDPSPKFTSDDFTVSLWFNSAAPNKTNWLFMRGFGYREQRGDVGLKIDPDDGKLDFVAIIANYQFIFGWSPIPTRLSSAFERDRWNHVVVTRRGDTYSMWMNGARVGVKESPVDFSDAHNTTPFIIGGFTYESGVRELFQGALDDFRIFRRCLSEKEIGTLYDCGGDATVLDGEGRVKIGPLVTGSGSETDYAPRAHALQFDGKSAYVDLGHALDFGKISAFSVDFWMKSPYVPRDNQQMIVGKGEGFRHHNAPGWTVFTAHAGFLYFQLHGGYSPFVNELQAWNIDTLVRDGRWHHVVVTYNGNRDLSGVAFYIDGKAKQLGSDSNNLRDGDIRNYVHAAIGAPPTPGMPSDAFYQGALSELHVFDRAITPADVAKLYADGAGNYGAQGVGGLVAGYHLDEGQGTTVADFSGHGRDGTLKGATWVSGRGTAAVPHPNAVQFDGRHYAKVESPPKFTSGDFTISLWFNAVMPGISDFLFMRGFAYRDRRGDIGLDLIREGGNLGFKAATGYNQWIFGWSPESRLHGAVRYGLWNHAVVTRRGHKYTMWMNGAQVGSEESSADISDADDGNPFIVGGMMEENGGVRNMYQGALDDFRIFRRCLSDKEIGTLYDRNGDGGSLDGEGRVKVGRLVPAAERSASDDAVIPKGMRVIAVGIPPKSETIVRGAIHPGMRVDVQLSYRRGEKGLDEGGKDGGKTGVNTVLRDIRVIAVNDAETVETQDGERKATRSVSLLVTPNQAELITAAATEDGIRLIIRDAAEKNPNSRLYHQTYPVGDLVTPLPWAEGVKLPGTVGTRSNDREMKKVGIGKPGTPAVKPDFKPLTDLILEKVAPETWLHQGGKGTINYSAANLSLVINQTEDVHTKIECFLENLRRRMSVQVNIQARYIEADGDVCKRLGVNVDSVAFAPTRARKFMERVQQSPGTSGAEMPYVTVFADDQAAAFTVPGHGTCSVRPVVSGDRFTVCLNLGFKPDGKAGEELPAISVNDGDSAVINLSRLMGHATANKTTPAGNHLLLMLRPRILVPEEEDKLATPAFYKEKTPAPQSSAPKKVKFGEENVPGTVSPGTVPASDGKTGGGVTLPESVSKMKR